MDSLQRISPISSTFIDLKWTEPALNDRNGPITGYEVTWRQVSINGLPVSDAGVANRFVQESRINITGLEESASYEVALQSVNGAGRSDVLRSNLSTLAAGVLLDDSAIAHSDSEEVPRRRVNIGSLTKSHGFRHDPVIFAQ